MLFTQKSSLVCYMDAFPTNILLQGAAAKLGPTLGKQKGILGL